MDAFEEREKDSAYDRKMFKFGILTGTIGCTIFIIVLCLLGL